MSRFRTGVLTYGVRGERTPAGWVGGGVRGLLSLAVAWLLLASSCGETTATPPTVASDELKTAEWSWYAVAQVYSFHEHTTDVYLHNTTPGLGLMGRHDDWLLGAGIFRNSLGRWAGLGYAGWQYPVVRLRTGAVRVGAIVGLTHHYNWNHGSLVPLAAAAVTLPVTRNVAIELIGIPRVANATYTTLNLSLSIRLK